MDLSIVIVNWNTEDLLRDCLRSVSVAIGDLQVEVLVVDNASDDGSVAMLQKEFPWVTLIETQQNLGFSGGNNVALRRATARYVMLLNTDTLLHDDVLKDSVSWLDRHPKVGVMGPRVLNTDGSVQTSCSAFPSLRNLTMQTLGLTKITRLDRYRMTGWDRQSERHVDVISGAAMFVRRNAMQEVGLLDEAFFFYGEETDWCRRFKEANWDLVFTPIQGVTHFGNGSACKLNHRRDVLMTQGTTRLHLKHGGVPAGIACFAILAMHNLTRAMFWAAMSLLKRPGSWDRAIHFIRVTVDFRKAWPATKKSIL